MTRTYGKQMFRHIIYMLIFMTITFCSAILAIGSIFFLNEDWSDSLSTVICSTIFMFMFGMLSIKEIKNLFSEHKKGVTISKVYIVKFGKIQCSDGESTYSVKIATDRNGVNYFLNRKALQYFEQNGLGWYDIGIQEETERIDRYLASSPYRNPIYLIEPYSIYKVHS